MLYNTKEEFKNAVLAESNVDAILGDTADEQNSVPGTETVGGWYKGYLTVLMEEEAGGKNFRNVWYMHNTATGETGHQTANTLNASSNNLQKKQVALEDYLKSTFDGYFINRLDLKNNWAECDVYEVSGGDLSKSTVLVFKQGASIAHRKIV